MNMFKPTKAQSVKEYIKLLPLNRKKEIIFLHEYIQKLAPSLKTYFAFNMLGYGSFKYKNYKNEQIDWPLVSLANQKNYISIYVCAIKDGKYIAEIYKEELGKVSVGKSCIRFKQLSDLNLNTLKKIIQYTVKNPGLKKVSNKE